MQSHSPGTQDTSSIALITGSLLVRTNGLLRIFSQKMWQERLVTLTTQELYVFKVSVLSNMKMSTWQEEVLTWSCCSRKGRSPTLPPNA